MDVVEVKNQYRERSSDWSKIENELKKVEIEFQASSRKPPKGWIEEEGSEWILEKTLKVNWGMLI